MGYQLKKIKLMEKKQRLSLKASPQGKQLINQAKEKKGWDIDDERWLRDASKILEPDTNWDVIYEQRQQGSSDLKYANNILLTTWKDFLKASKSINDTTFKAFCQVLELNWLDVAVRTRQRATLKASERGKQLITDKRREKGWTIDDERWLREASKELEPEKNWDAIYEQRQQADSWLQYAENISKATLKRYVKGANINNKAFKAFSKALEMDWEELAIRNRDLSDADPPPTSFFGRTQELKQLEEWLIQQKPCRLVVIHGVRGIGKSALVRQFLENQKITNKYNYIIWRSLDSAPLFKEFVANLIEFISEEEKNQGDISLLMQYLHQHKCLLVLDLEEIASLNAEESQYYNDFLTLVAKKAHQSSVLWLSREKPPILESFEGKLVSFLKLQNLICEDIKELLKVEGISGTEDEIDTFCKNYKNPGIIKIITKKVKNLRGKGSISGVFGEPTVLLVDELKSYLNEQFKRLSPIEINIIYWIAIRRNSASCIQLRRDTVQSVSVVSPSDLLDALESLIDKHSLVDKNEIEDDNNSEAYILDLVILKYLTNRFVEESCQQIVQVIKNQSIEGSELFLSHSFITENSEDEELTLEQIKRIVKPIYQKLLTELRIQPQQVQAELNKIMSRLEDRGFSPGYARQNILLLLEQSNSI